MKGTDMESGRVPEAVMDAVNQTLANVEAIHTHLDEFLTLSDPDVLIEMPPLERARSLFLLGKITTTLYACKSSSGHHRPNFYIFFRTIRITDLPLQVWFHLKPFLILLLLFSCLQ